MRPILVLIVAALLPAGLSAQVHVGVQFNFGLQPAWGPAVYGYVEYYYMPELEVYYHVPMRRFYTLDGGHWVSHPRLPHRYRHVDLYRVHKVVINEPHPWYRHAHYRERYVSYRSDRHHPSLRDAHDTRYFDRSSHPGKGKWNKNKHGMKPGKGNRGRGRK